MTTRAILIQPEFANMEEVEQLRSLYDPLYGKTAPHITLVFPFSSGLSDDEVLLHVAGIASKNCGFDLKLKGISSGNPDYILLNVSEGHEQVIDLHKQLYTGILKPTQTTSSQYVPHMTLGRIPDRKSREEAIREIGRLDLSIESVADYIVIERIDADEFGEIVAKVKLGACLDFNID